MMIFLKEKITLDVGDGAVHSGGLGVAGGARELAEEVPGRPEGHEISLKNFPKDVFLEKAEIQLPLGHVRLGGGVQYFTADGPRSSSLLGINSLFENIFGKNIGLHVHSDKKTWNILSESIAFEIFIKSFCPFDTIKYN